MVVNSWPFLLFFIVVFIIYYLPIAKGNSKFQNAWLLLASYFFYGYINVKMIALLLGSTIIFYLLGLGIRKQLDKEEFSRAAWIRTAGVVIGVGILFYFKYLNFFADSVAHLLSSLGMKATWTTLNIVMPVGVSFFTFKLISYVVEVCRERIEPTRDFVSFANYVSFFPTILSGPIDCPKEFLGQMMSYRRINSDLAIDGLRQIIWGLMKKMVIADNLYPFVDSTWGNIDSESSFVLFFCALIYPMQMYMDFSGYSDMAIGVAKILNIKVPKNFNYPFFSTNIAEYWRRWHISLTSWLTEYIFKPISISLREWGMMGLLVAIMINLVSVGLWHGANWTFLLFGLYHSLLFVPIILNGEFNKKEKVKFKGYIPSFKFIYGSVCTYLFVSLGLIIFRALDINEAIKYISHIFTADQLFSLPTINKLYLLFMIGVMLMEWRAFIKKNLEFAIQTTEYGWKSWVVDFIVILICTCFSYTQGDVDFIYMKF